MIPADTSPEVDRLYRSLVMQRTGAERLRMGAAMFDAALVLVVASIRHGTVDPSEADLRAAAFMRIYATDLDERTRGAVIARLRRLASAPAGMSQSHREDRTETFHEPEMSAASRRAQHKRWLDNWKRVGPLLEAERWERLRNMSDEEARRTVRDVHDLWQDDWVGDAGEELLLHQQTFARARRRAG